MKLVSALIVCGAVLCEGAGTITFKASEAPTGTCPETCPSKKDETVDVAKIITCYNEAVAANKDCVVKGSLIVGGQLADACVKDGDEDPDNDDGTISELRIPGVGLAAYEGLDFTPIGSSISLTMSDSANTGFAECELAVYPGASSGATATTCELDTSAATLFSLSKPDSVVFKTPENRDLTEVLSWSYVGFKAAEPAKCKMTLKSFEYDILTELNIASTTSTTTTTTGASGVSPLMAGLFGILGLSFLA